MTAAEIDMNNFAHDNAGARYAPEQLKHGQWEAGMRVSITQAKLHPYDHSPLKLDEMDEYDKELHETLEEDATLQRYLPDEELWRLRLDWNGELVEYAEEEFRMCPYKEGVRVRVKRL